MKEWKRRIGEMGALFAVNILLILLAQARG